MSLHYDFPLIETINDVLPAIKDKPEFIVAERDEYTVINYVYASETTFPTVTDKDSAILRECRGLIFGKDGKILSRRYHKFFNYGERPDVQDLDITKSHVILDKLDGSMISPIRIHQDRAFGFRLTTKIGITDIAMQAEVFVSQQPDAKNYSDVFSQCEYLGMTPIFEWCSPKNRIIVPHDRDHLILTAVRDNKTGKYIDMEKGIRPMNFHNLPYLAPQKIEYDSFQRLVADTRQKNKIEGFVIRFDDGHMVKIKTDEYVLFHKTKDSLSRECDVAKICIEDAIDDFIPCLHENDRASVRIFHRAINERILSLIGECKRERAVWDSRKEFALNFPNSFRKTAIFSIWDGKEDPGASIRKVLLSNCNDAKKYDAMKTELFPNLPGVLG